MSSRRATAPAEQITTAWTAGDRKTAAELAAQWVSAEESPVGIELLCLTALAADQPRLLPTAARVAMLALGPGRQAALARRSLEDDDLPGAAERLASDVGDEAPHPELADTVYALLWRDIASAAAGSGDWDLAQRSVESGRVRLQRLRRRPPRLEFDLRALQCAVEWHTHAGLVEYAALSETIGALRNRNLLNDAHALAVVELATVEMSRGDLGRAGVDLQRAAALAERRPDLRDRARAAAALALFRQGRWAAAEALVREPSGATEVEAAAGLLGAFRSSTAAPAEKSRPEGGLSVTAAQIAFHADVLGHIAGQRWNDLRHLLHEGEHPGHRSTLRSDEWNALRALADWHTGRRSAVRNRLAVWSMDADAATSPYFWAFHAILAELDSRFDEGYQAITTALAALHADCDPLGAAWVRMVAGTYLTRHGSDGQGDPVAGLDSYESARELLSHIGAAPFLAVCDNIIGTVTHELQSARTIDPTVTLTGPQLEVARLVADGYTSREIAELLHLTRSTVDFHVANILRRLSLDSRRQIRKALGGN